MGRVRRCPAPRVTDSSVPNTQASTRRLSHIRCYTAARSVRAQLRHCGPHESPLKQIEDRRLGEDRNIGPPDRPQLPFGRTRGVGSLHQRSPSERTGECAGRVPAVPDAPSRASRKWTYAADPKRRHFGAAPAVRGHRHRDAPARCPARCSRGGRGRSSSCRVSSTPVKPPFRRRISGSACSSTNSPFPP